MAKKSVTKKELIDGMVSYLNGQVNRKTVEATVKAFVETVKKEVGEKGAERIAIIGFGTFVVKERAARVGRDPKTGKEIQIAASRSVGFRAGSELKAAVNGKESK